MANHKSAKKRIKVSERKRIRNKSALSEIKTKVKSVLNSENPEEAEKNYKEAISVLDKKSLKGIIHKNNAARKKAQLTKYVNGLKSSK